MSEAMTLDKQRPATRRAPVRVSESEPPLSHIQPLAGDLSQPTSSRRVAERVADFARRAYPVVLVSAIFLGVLLLTMGLRFAIWLPMYMRH